METYFWRDFFVTLALTDQLREGHLLQIHRRQKVRSLQSIEALGRHSKNEGEVGQKAGRAASLPGLSVPLSRRCRGTEKEGDIWAEQSWVGWRETLGRDVRLLPGSIYNPVHHVVGSVIIQQQTVQMYSSSSDCVCFAKALAAECSQHEWSQNGLCLRRVFVTNIHCTLRLFS